MNKKQKDFGRELTDDEIKNLVTLIAKPTLEYMMNLIQTNIIQNNAYNNVNASSLLSVIFSSCASIDTSFLRWIHSILDKKNDAAIEFHVLCNAYKDILNKNLAIELH